MVLSSHDPGSLMGFSTQWWVGLRRFAFAHRDLDPDE
jgi:hypothetical protein